MMDTVPDDFFPALDIADAEGLECVRDGRIELEGLPNTRDMGGIPVSDGRFVKHARLIRSGALGRATERDLAVLTNEYGLRTVIDLRTGEECREHPDPEDELAGVRFRHAPVLSAATFGVTHEGGMLGAIKTLREAQKDPAQVMMDVYANMALSKDSQQGFARFFDEVLAAEEGSVLWHCTIGKDRAGLAAAFLLSVLGASREAIEADYEATNRHVESRSQDIMDALSTYGLAGKLDKSIHLLNSADPRFLGAALDAIDSEFGGMDTYAREVLNVTDEKLRILRGRYLTDDPRG